MKHEKHHGHKHVMHHSHEHAKHHGPKQEVHHSHQTHHMSHHDAAKHRVHHSHHHSGPIPFARGESEEEGRPWGHGEYANMPQEVVFQQVGPTPHFMEENINDTMRRLDEDSHQAIRGERKGYDRGMY